MKQSLAIVLTVSSVLLLFNRSCHGLSVSKELRAKDGSLPRSAEVAGNYGSQPSYQSGYESQYEPEPYSDQYSDSYGDSQSNPQLGRKFTGLQSLVSAVGEFIYAILQTLGIVAPKQEESSYGY